MSASDRRTYLTVLSTDDYAVGAAALWKSLRNTGPRHQFLAVLTSQVSARCEQALQGLGMPTLRIEQDFHRAPSKGADRAFAHWQHTFGKLLMFQLTQYEKIVFLDSDMLVLRNLDHLFDKPHMSAMVPNKLLPGHESWVQFCSGLMVIEPQPGLAKAVMQHAAEVEARTPSFSDQHLLHEHFPGWPSRTELHLEQGYGIFLDSIDRYVKKFGYNLNFAAPDERTIAVVHFVGSRKPWTWSAPERALRMVKYAAGGGTIAVRMLRQYLRLLDEARKSLWR